MNRPRADVHELSFGVSSGQQCLKYQFMMTQTERESNKSCRPGDNKCLPKSKARGGGGGVQDFLIGGPRDVHLQAYLL